MNWRPLLVASAVIAGCAPGDGSARPMPDTSAPPTSTGRPTANATVAAVIDGDTIDARFGDRIERVRLIGVDTPETKQPHVPVECYGPEASIRTAELLPAGTPIAVVRDREARDDYGRLLAYVFRGSDGLFVNLSLITDGYARPLTIEPNVAYRGDLVGGATAAEAAGRGLWGACSG